MEILLMGIYNIAITTIYIRLEKVCRKRQEERLKSQLPKFTDDEMVQLTESLNPLGYLIIFEKYGTHATVYPCTTEEKTNEEINCPLEQLEIKRPKTVYTTPSLLDLFKRK